MLHPKINRPCLAINLIAAFAAGCAVPTEFATTSDPTHWTDAPPEWTEGIDFAAFCAPGEWFFSAAGEASWNQPYGIYATEALDMAGMLEPVGGWPSGPPHDDELTTLRIARDENRVVRFEIFVGPLLAYEEPHGPELRFSSFPGRREVVATTQCQPGVALWLPSAFYSGDLGDGVLAIDLALAKDGSLIVRKNHTSCFFCGEGTRSRLNEPGATRYARFPATGAPVQPRALGE